MDFVPLSSCSRLDDAQKTALQKGNINNIADLLLTPSNTIAKQCQLSQLDISAIMDSVCKERCKPVRLLEHVVQEGNEVFTTGDSQLDHALGGGIRTGMVWEIAGESAAGKTQMALQAALTVQIPPALGGLSGSACYLVTSSRLPTSRLLQISEAHPLLSPSVCGLANIHTLSAPNAPILTRILSETLPNFLKERTAHPSPIKLLVIDALAELFHVSAKTSSSTLVERSKNISEISTILHSLASTYQLAVVVLNEVSDVFDRSSRPGSGDQTDIVYREQVRWFSRAHSIPGEDRKEACLGLVWANQVNVRILLSRTGRRRHQDEIEGWLSKQQKFGDGQNPPGARCPSSADDPTILIRRLSVIFTSVGRPRSLDYIVTIGGISTLPDETAPFNHAALTRENVGISTTSYITGELQVPSLNGEVQKATKRSISDDESEDDYWNDDIPDEIYNSIDLDFLANVTSKSLPNSKIEASPRKTHTKDIFRSPQS